MIKKATRQSEKWYTDYLKSDYTELWQVYGRFSKAKAKAYERCRALCAELQGRRFRIVSVNTMAFTVGFEFPHPQTGELCFAYITKDYDRYFMI